MAEHDTAQQQEPTMEEILASIRRIISEDGDEGEQAPDAAGTEDTQPEQPEPAQTAAPQETSRGESADDENDTSGGDVLELTDVVEEDDSSDVTASTDYRPEGYQAEPSVEDEVEMIEQLDTESDVDAGTSHQGGTTLLSPEKASAASSAIQELSRRTRLADGESRTLEVLVQEMMRPMLKQWLDQNLPRMVEKIVEREVRRITDE